MPETRSSATDHVMSQTSLNKGQRQMDSVLKSWGFRTSRDPFQENSSQVSEGNKGQKSTPLRRVVCPLERSEREQLQLERVPGTDVEPEADREEVSCCGHGVCYCSAGIGLPPRDCAWTQLQSVRRSFEIGPWELPLPEEC